MNKGYILLHRKTINSDVFKNSELLKLWVWCLSKANYKHTTTTIVVNNKPNIIKLEPGQFIFGRKKAANQLNMKETTVRKRMRKLEELDNIRIKATHNYSIITIIDWRKYQGATPEGKTWYQKYLHSPIWKKTRARLKKKYINEYGSACAICKKPCSNLQAHHLNYFNLGKEELHKDIIFICPSCHKKEHEIE